MWNLQISQITGEQFPLVHLKQGTCEKLIKPGSTSEKYSLHKLPIKGSLKNVLMIFGILNFYPDIGFPFCIRI